MKKRERETAIFTAFDDIIPWDPAQRERCLLQAVLLASVHDLRSQGDARRRAVEYFLSSEEEYLFSFRSICDYLEVDPELILSRLGLRP